MPERLAGPGLYKSMAGSFVNFPRKYFLLGFHQQMRFTSRGGFWSLLNSISYNRVSVKGKNKLTTVNHMFSLSKTSILLCPVVTASCR